MNVTLVGRPGKVIHKAAFVLTSMEVRRVPLLPKGRPTPPATPTFSTVCIAKKQWAKVSDAIENPDDVLILEGWATDDPELEGIAVFATNVTTKLAASAKRAPPAA